MQFTTTTLLITSLMASGLMATPFADPEPDLVELSSEQHEGGSIVQYGEDKRSMAPRADCGGFFQPACPKTCKKWSLEEPECDDKNGGTNNVCENLLNDLFGNQSIELQKDAKQLCWKNEDGKTGCCVKWTKTVPGLTKGDLKEHANKSTSPFLAAC